MTRSLHVSSVIVVATLVGLFACTVSADVFNMPNGLTSLETVRVGNAGNAADSTGYGSVGYSYNISKYEVTAGQYCAFLNAVAKVNDPYGLYSPFMNEPSYQGCGIKRIIDYSGNYSFIVYFGGPDLPVNFVGWSDAARFCNWLHNGQPTGTLTGNAAQDAWLTEDGSYYLNGATGEGPLTRKANATYVIPTEDEWYKAAYHKNDGVTGNYWDYPTSSDSINTGMANYDTPVGGNRTKVGSYAYSSPYGTFDQGGNVMELIETMRSNYSNRLLRGGSYISNETLLRSSVCETGSGEFGYGGIRIVEVPEPASLALLTFGGFCLFRRRRGMGK